METDVKFNKETDSLLELLNPSGCKYHAEGTSFSIKERKEKGKANVEVFSDYPCLVIHDLDQQMTTPRFLNCKQEKSDDDPVSNCADHAIFLFDRKSGTWTLHIVEFKRTLDKKTLPHALCQFSGAMVRSYAIAGIMRISGFEQVHLHCGYRNDKTNNTPKSNFADLKSPLGKPVPITKKIRTTQDFLDARFPLLSYPKLIAKNHLIPLDDNGYAEIKLDKSGCAITPHNT